MIVIHFQPIASPVRWVWAAILLLAAVVSAAPAGPAGIFVIGDTREVPGEVAKFDFDFVSGYTLRVPWTDIETWNEAAQAPQYAFSRMPGRSTQFYQLEILEPAD